MDTLRSAALGLHGPDLRRCRSLEAILAKSTSRGIHILSVCFENPSLLEIGETLLARTFDLTVHNLVLRAQLLHLATMSSCLLVGARSNVRNLRRHYQKSPDIQRNMLLDSSPSLIDLGRAVENTWLNQDLIQLMPT